MTAIRLDGRRLSAKIIEKLKDRVKAESLTPCLATILVGDDAASRLYVSLKREACESIGGTFKFLELPGDASTESVVKAIEGFASDARVDGILLQLPLPKQVEQQVCLSAIPLEKDVDGLNPLNLARIFERRPGFVPATAKAVLAILKELKTPLEGARCMVIGRSVDVGVPVAGLLLDCNATVTVAHSRTRDLARACADAEIIVSATGKAGIVTKEMVRAGVTIVDVGTNFIDVNGKRRVVGDVDPAVAEIAGAVTPVPGGVGPVTIACLLENLVEAAARKRLKG